MDKDSVNDLLIKISNQSATKSTKDIYCVTL